MESKNVEKKSTLSRRSFLLRLSGGGLAGLGGGVLLAGCTSASDQQTEGSAGAASASPCTDLSGLTEQQKRTRRQTFQYVNDSPKPNQQCDNCQFWTPPEGEEPCGRCQLVKGPIDPEGWCNSWTAQQS